MRKEPYDIPCIHESLAKDVAAGRITLEEAACELCRSGWTNFVDLEYTKRCLEPYIERHMHNEV